MAGGNITDVLAQVVTAAAAGWEIAATSNADLIARTPPEPSASAPPATTATVRRGGEPVSSPAEEFWDGHYRQHQGHGSGRANPVLVDVAGPLAPGTALDLGCGEGNDALWLASQGWAVTAVDVSATVLARVAARAAARGLSEQVEVQQHDLSRTIPDGGFDLVSAQYLQSPVPLPREQILRRAATAVTPGGLLLVVTHASVPPWSWADPDTVFPDPTQALAALQLDLDRWEIVRLDDPSREATGPSGQKATVTDTVIELRRLTS